MEKKISLWMCAVLFCECFVFVSCISWISDMPRNDGGILSWGDMNKPYSLLKLSRYVVFGCTLPIWFSLPLQPLCLQCEFTFLGIKWSPTEKKINEANFVCVVLATHELTITATTIANWFFGKPTSHPSRLPKKKKLKKIGLVRDLNPGPLAP